MADHVRCCTAYIYDSFGRRTTKTINGVTTKYFHDGLNVVQEQNGTGGITANVLTGLGIDEILTRTDSVGARGFLSDALGTTIALVDNAGIVQTEYKYEPYGSVNRTGQASQNAFTYTGREDDGTGLYYYRARYYHPRLQRFISEDPIGFGGGEANLYAYAGQNSTRWSDPYGLAKCTYSIGSHTLRCTADSGQSQEVGPSGIFSGLGECRNNVQCAAERDRGPTPPGVYEMVPTDKYGGSYWLKEGWFSRQLCKMGFGRCEFFLHAGMFSRGCITADKTDPIATSQYGDLKQLLSRDPSNVLEVTP
ncbi:MAG: RHS repeat-associated core domain-containing protein [Nitrospiraceae bacterium]